MSVDLRRISAAFAAAVFTAGLLLAQQGSPQPTGTPPPDQSSDTNNADNGQPTIRVTTTFVLAPVTVTDRDGTFVPGLSPEDFRLFDNGKLQTITTDIGSHPLSLVVAIQANSNVEKILPQIQRIGNLLHDQLLGGEVALENQGEVAVLAFDHRIQTLTDFTSDQDTINAALKKLKPGSSSSRLNDAAITGIHMLKNRPNSRRKVLLLISEARDIASEVKPREVLTEAEFANVVIYSVNMSQLYASLTAKPQPGRPNTIPPGGQYYPAGVVGTPTLDSQMDMGNWVPLMVDIFNESKKLVMPDPLTIYTRYTGGREYTFMKQNTLDKAISNIGSELHSQYLLTYNPNNQTEAGFHEITVTVRRSEAKVRTRDGYYWAGKPQ